MVNHAKGKIHWFQPSFILLLTTVLASLGTVRSLSPLPSIYAASGTRQLLAPLLQHLSPHSAMAEACFHILSGILLLRLSSLLRHGLQVSFELLCFLTSLYEQWTGNRTNVSQNETLAFRSESANLSSFAMEASPHYRYSPSPAAVYLDPLFILLQLFPKDSETLQFFLLSPK